MSTIVSNDSPGTFVHRLGQFVLDFILSAGSMALFCVRLVKPLWRIPRGKVLWPIMHDVGVQSLPVILITGLFIGMVLAVQSYDTLRVMHFESRIGSVINVTLVKELGPVLAATMLAGRIGSAIAAEIGRCESLSKSMHSMRWVLIRLRILSCPASWRASG